MRATVRKLDFANGTQPWLARRANGQTRRFWMWRSAMDWVSGSR